MKQQKPRGTRDFLPEEMERRNELFSILRATALKYGYGQMETPAFEELDLLTEKSGEEVEKQIFILEKRSKEKVGLRFDMTVPATRLFVEKQKSLPKPVKWFYSTRMWRYESPQKGRLREFYQFGVENFGSKEPEADAEVISLGIDCLLNLGLKKGQFLVGLNNRKIIQGLLEGLKVKKIEEPLRLIDKREKITETEFTKSLENLGLKKEQIENIKLMLECKSVEDVEVLDFTNKKVEEGLLEVKNVLELLKAMGKDGFVKFDITIVRGLAYYTGLVFECFDKDKELRTIFGGGRYDNLVEKYGGQKTPATGFAMGDVTLQLLLERNNLWKKETKGVDFFVVTVGNLKKEALEVVGELRKKYSVETDLMNRGVSKQLDYANKIKAKKVLFVGEEELKNNKFTVKDMGTGKEEKKSIKDLL